MYQVFWGEFLLHDLRLNDYFLQSPELSEEINKVSEFTFDIYPDHPHFSKLEVLVPNIIVKKDGNTIFKGRIISEKMNMDNSKQVTCESELAFLFDSIQRPFDFQGTPEALFTQLITTHNSQVEDYKKIKIGKLTGANLDNNNYINRSSESYANIFDTINDKILDTIGGYIQIRYETDGTYIDWLDDFTSEINGVTGQIVSAQEIEFGENLIDITAENDATETYTVVIPLGAEIEEKDEETGETTKTRLTIEEVNEGLDYLVNETALAKYGWIVAPVDETTWDDVTVASNLKTKAQEFLNNQGIMLKSTLELNALDLSVVDKNIDDFKMGEYIKVKSTPHNLSKTYLLTKKTTPLDKPENMEVTLGETKNTLTGIQIGSGKDTINKVETILGGYVLNDNVTNIINEEINNSSYIGQLPDQILNIVSEQYTKQTQFEEYQQTISTQLEQTASGWEFQFSDIINQIQNVEGEVSANYSELIKYIRFENGTIILGVLGNEITLKLQNDRLSFLQNNVEVAYMSNGKLYITDGEFLNSLIVGNFAFQPRANNSLSFNKVKR